MLKTEQHAKHSLAGTLYLKVVLLFQDGSKLKIFVQALPAPLHLKHPYLLISIWQVLFNSNHQVWRSAWSIKGLILFCIHSSVMKTRKPGEGRCWCDGLCANSQLKWWPSVLRPAMQHHPLLVSHCHMQITSPSVSLSMFHCVCMHAPLHNSMCM